MRWNYEKYEAIVSDGSWRMRIEQLLYFQTVARLQSFSKASDSLYVSQPTLSKQIKALENELGGKLFIRKNKFVYLSPFGAKVEGSINDIIKDYELLQQLVDNYKLNRLKKLRIASIFNMASCGILEPIIKYESSRSNFYIETTECDHTKIQQLLTSNAIDVSFGYTELIGKSGNYDIVPLRSEPLVLVTNRHHAEDLCWPDEIALADAREERFCFPREDSLLFAFYFSSCQLSGFTPELTHSNVRLSTISKYISVDIRCTLQLKSVADALFHSEEFKVIALKDAPTLTLAILTDKTHLDSTGKDFVEYIVDYYKDYP